MIDRDIRNTRSKEETKKAHKQAVLTMIILFAAFLAVTRIQDLIMNAFKNAGAAGFGLILAVCAGIVIVGAAVYLEYRYGKNRQN